MKASMSDNVVVFDVETQREFAEVGGREFAEQLGISVAVAYHTGERRFYTFEERELDGLFYLFTRASLLVGFNILQFDFRVLSAYTDLDLSLLPSIDMLADIRAVLGFRVKLDSIAQQTLGIRKSADGT